VRPRRIVVPLVALAVASIVVAGALTGSFSTLARRAVDASAPAQASVAPSTAGKPQPSPSVQRTPSLAPVLAPAAAGTKPSPDKVRSRIAAVDDSVMKATVSAAVLDVGSGDVLYADDAGTPAIPASTMKLLTSAVALDILGADHEFTTKVVSPATGGIVLVGGGDPYLASRTTAATYPKRASLAELAKATATELKRTKQTKVTLGYDTSLFAGPSWSPSWPSGYRDQVTPVSALSVDGGRVNGFSPGPPQTDPARVAARAFASALKHEGIAVSGVSAARAAKSARTVAAVSSMPLQRIVEQLLLVSDNDAAEVVLRQAAIGAGRPGSFTDGRAVVKGRLTALGAWRAGTVIDDGSGLSRKSKVPAATMVGVLRLAAEPERPELRAVLTGLPVAGVEGSLRGRFGEPGSAAGIGLVHGKTGTLRQVHSLAGVVRSADGSLMVFAFLVNNTANDFAATVWLDRVTAALSSCGCR
jgi:D-alanyl-D-alanine carboxypeptidase/D-alanyl-D-alanine-endopeptidase (penicillin-binding protein 4)